MNLRGPIAAALAAVLLGAAPHRPASLTVYSAPAGDRPAGASPGRPTAAILPDGRTASPLGTTIFVGTNPFGVTLTPDGRYAVVTNDSQRTDFTPPGSASNLVSGYSLTVVDTRTMRVTDVYRGDSVQFFTGLAAVRDPANPGRTIVLASDGAANDVRVFDLGGDGRLSIEPQAIALTGASTGGDATGPRVFPASIDVAANGRVAYVANNLGGTVSAIDIASRTLLHSATVGFYPFGVVSAGTHVFVTNGGLAQYHVLPKPAQAPVFANAPADPYKSSSLSVVPLQSNGDVSSDAASIIRMDPVPNGVDAIGGARPNAIVARKDGRYAYVALANVDRIATVSLYGGDPHVIGGLDLRLFINAPYGTEPSAEALSKDGKTLYVALAGINAVAVLDAHNPAQLHRLGLIPTGWYPSALALSPDGRYLYIADAKGVDGWGLLQRVDTKHFSLVKATLAALHYNRAAAPAKQNLVVPALRSNRQSNSIDHVVYISVGTDSFDAMLGELKDANGAQHGDGDAQFSLYPESATPNLHALARAYGLADNFYVNDLNIDANQQFALSGVTTLYTARTLDVNAGRTPLDAHGQDPENYARAGYLFNALAKAQLSYRDYGGLMRLSGYGDVDVPNDPTPAPTRGRKNSPRPESTPGGLGGAYTLDVPALAALGGHVDLDYPGWNPQISDMQRAQAFATDMDALVKAGQMPTFTYLWLPTAPGSNGVADADRALGKVVEYLSHTPHWSSTAIFIVPDGIINPRDHVNLARSYALVVSPLAKRGYVGHAHLSLASVLKTEEELLGLPPLALSDLLATDMADFFGDVPYPSPYQALP